MLVPVGIAYAVASGVPGIYGLYATIVPLLAYALFGPSRILVLGPDSSLAAVILGVVLPLSGGDPHRAVALAGMMAIVSGIVCILAGVARLGFVTELLSKPIRYGYMNGIALTVLISQLPKLFGFSIESDGPLRNLWAIAEAVLGGRANWTAFAVGAGTLAVILLLKGSKRLPGILIAVVGATAIVGVLDLAAARRRVGPWSAPAGPAGVRDPVDHLRRYRPGPDRRLSPSPWCRSPTPACSPAPTRREPARMSIPTRRWSGLGAANLAAGFFQGFPISSSSSRTPVAEAAGARTQLTGVVGALAVALLLLVAPNLLQHLPTAALAAVVIASAIGLIEVTDLIRIYRIQRWEFWLSIVCLVGVAVLGAIPGIGLAIVIAVIEFLWDGWRPHSAVLGRAEGVKGYHDITRYPDARQIPGLVLFRWDAPLFFANAELFKERVLDAVAKSPTPVRWLVVAAEPVTSVDVTAADTLAELDEALHGAGIELCFAELKDPVKDKLKRFGLFAQIRRKVLLSHHRGRRRAATSRATRWIGWTGKSPANPAPSKEAEPCDELAPALRSGRDRPGIPRSRAASPRLSQPPRSPSCPLPAWMGRATEQLAERMGEGVGGLLNATFGNAAELIIALAALRAGLHDVVKASIAGSIVGNILLVLGAAMLAGGLRRPEQHFNPAGARSQATMLTLAAIALVLPAAFQAAAGHDGAEALGRLSVSISVVLLLVYLLYLAFALVTHSALFTGSHVPEEGEAHAPVDVRGPRWCSPPPRRGLRG